MIEFLSRRLAAALVTLALATLVVFAVVEVLPGDPALWCVCCSIVFVCGPLGDAGPWHCRQMVVAGSRRSALFSVPCTSWQLAHVTPR